MLGQPFIIENKAGGGGLIAASAVARAQPDGYTLLFTTNTTHSAAPGLFKNVPYDPIKDFAPVARIGSFPSFVAVNPSLPIHTMASSSRTPRQIPASSNTATATAPGRSPARRSRTAPASTSCGSPTAAIQPR